MRVIRLFVEETGIYLVAMTTLLPPTQLTALVNVIMVVGLSAVVARWVQLMPPKRPTPA